MEPVKEKKTQTESIKKLKEYKETKLSSLYSDAKNLRVELDKNLREIEVQISELLDKKRKEEQERQPEISAPAVKTKKSEPKEKIVEKDKLIENVEKDKTDKKKEKADDEKTDAKVESVVAQKTSSEQRIQLTQNAKIGIIKSDTPHAPIRRIYIPQERDRNGRPQNKTQNTFGNGARNNNKPNLQKTPTLNINNAPAAAKNAPQTKKKKDTQKVDERSAKSKRTLMRMGIIVDDNISLDEDADISRRFKVRRSKDAEESFTPTPVVIDHAVITTDNVPIKVLSEKIGKTASEIIKKVFDLGIMVNINGSIDFDTAEMVAAEYGITLEHNVEKTKEELLQVYDEDQEDENAKVTRPPVVTIMGHVDHGKTTLLDYIRKSDVAGGEAGGITQHIGAYTVTVKGQTITFIDTPGHEAFTEMRSRGAQVTDIVIIVVAADDGIMPQTIEAINHAKAAKVPIIIAINKMDKDGANPDKIMQQLTEYELIPEEWGGDTVMVQISAKKGTNVDKLLENVLLVAEMQNLKANPDRSARGVIIEAKLDKNKGSMATVLVQNGTLKVSDYLVAGTVTGKVRAMLDDKGRNVNQAGPSMPVIVLGFSDVPVAGDKIVVVNDEKLSRQVAEERKVKEREESSKTTASRTLEDLMKDVGDNTKKTLNVIIKADVQGSVEALKQSILKLANDEVKINVVHGAVGAVNESDVMLADTTSAIIIAFNIRPDTKAKALAEAKKIECRTYRIIYDAIDDISAAINGMLAPKFREDVLGKAEIRQVFKLSSAGTIGGSYVLEGKITRNAKLRLIRDNIVIYEGAVGSLRRLKDDVKEVAAGYECGIGISGYSDLKVGDIIEAFVLSEEKDEKNR